MIEQIRIRNFQRHEKLSIQLDPGITTIVGESDLGKSAVLRSLKWLIFNRPLGDSFIRHGSGHVSVRLKVDGHEILREKGPGLNSYSIDGHRYQFTPSGQDPPEAVSSLLNLGPDNFQSQHSQPFLLSNTPGEVAKKLNAIVCLDLIDRVLSDLASSVRKGKAVADVSLERLADAERDRDGLAWVPEAAGSLDRLEGMSANLAEKRETASRLAATVSIGREAKETFRTALEASQMGSRACQEGDRLAEIRSRRQRLAELMDKLILTESISKVRIPEDAVTELDWIGERVRVAREQSAWLRRLLGEANRATETVWQASDDLREAEAEFHEQAKGTCPLCGQEWGG